MTPPRSVVRRICAIAVGTVVLLGGVAKVCPAQVAVPAESKFAIYIDEDAAALGWTPLRAIGALGPDEREIRVWVGFGLFQPEDVLRLREDPTGIRGTRVFYWRPGRDAAWEEEAEREPNLISNRELRASLQQHFGCSSFLERAEYELCEVTLAQGQSWPSILASLDSLDIEILPDEATVIPPGRIGLDGVTMVVEVLAGSQYRTYSYWSPKATAPQPEVRRAAAILDAVSDIGYVK